MKVYFKEVVNRPNFFEHTSFLPIRFKEYDMVELTVVKPKYKKECVKKGMRGCVMREYAIKGQWQIKKLVEAAVEDSGLPICLHLDHGDSFELCKQCVDDGFTSVMIDASKLPFDQNIELSKKVAEYAHARGVVVEAELGTLAGVEEHVSNKYGCFTNPDEVEEFVSKTGVDSLAIAIGTSHGAFKFKGEAKLRFDILEEIAGRLPKFPIVLHGASSVPQQFVRIINENGGNMSGAQGVPEEMLRKAAMSAVCKINIDSDIRLACTATIRKYLNDNPAHFDPRQYLSPAREAIKQMVKHKILNVLGSNDKI